MIRKLLLGLMIASVASLAWAGIPDAGQSEVWVGEYPGVENCYAMFMPDGILNTNLEDSYRFFANAPVSYDCTIWAQVRNAAGNPIPLTPGDVWLEWGGNITLCSLETQDYALAMPQGAFPGLFYWEGTRNAGGVGEFHKVFVLGTELNQQAQLLIISADFVAPLHSVDGSDYLAFAGYDGNPSAEGDFNFDGRTDGSDYLLFSGYDGAGNQCP